MIHEQVRGTFASLTSAGAAEGILYADRQQHRVQVHREAIEDGQAESAKGKQGTCHPGSLSLL